MYSHALIAMTGLDRTKLSTTPSNIPTSYPFFLHQKICWLMKSNTRNNIIILSYYLKTPSWHGIYIHPFHFYPSNWAKASGNCFAAHWATSAKGGATSMEATWNHGNHGSHGTKARILATGVNFKDLYRLTLQVKKPPSWQIWIINVYMHMIMCIHSILCEVRDSHWRVVVDFICICLSDLGFFPLRLAKTWLWTYINLCLH